MTVTVSDLKRAKEAVRAAEKVAEGPYYESQGMTLKVVRGRKVPIGTTGVLEGWGENSYGPWYRYVTVDGEVRFIGQNNAVIVEISDAMDANNAALEAAKAAYASLLDEAKQVVGLDLNKPIASVEFRQNAYDDTSVADYAVNADAPDDLLSILIETLDPCGSGWGALRWSGGSYLMSRLSPTVARIRSVTRLCD